MTSVHLHALTLALCLAVTGCSSVLTATRDDPIDDNRGTRTIGSTIDDSLIETKAAVNIAKADRKSTRLNSSHMSESRMPSSA